MTHRGAWAASFVVFSQAQAIYSLLFPPLLVPLSSSHYRYFPTQILKHEYLKEVDAALLDPPIGK